MQRTVHRTIHPGFRNYSYEVRQEGETIETGEIIDTGLLVTVRPTDGKRRARASAKRHLHRLIIPPRADLSPRCRQERGSATSRRARPTAGSRCSRTRASRRRTPPGSSSTTRAKKPPKGVTARSRARSRSTRSTWRTTCGSTGCCTSSAWHCWCSLWSSAKPGAPPGPANDQSAAPFGGPPLDWRANWLPGATTVPPP
jgi:hypothetical protein